jgi:hypothetical protein
MASSVVGFEEEGRGGERREQEGDGDGIVFEMPGRGWGACGVERVVGPRRQAKLLCTLYCALTADTGWRMGVVPV